MHVTRSVLLLIILFIAQNLLAQGKKTGILPDQAVEVDIGFSKNGTGDVWGPIFSSKYGKYLKPRLHWDILLTGTIHDGSDPLYFKDLDGRPNDGSIRWVTGGVQVESHLGYALLRNTHHELLVQIGGLVRYQSTSIYDHYEILFPAATNLKFPVIVIDNRGPMRTIAIGASGQIQYNYIIKKIFSLGVLTGLQVDTNGDIIIPMMLSIGKRF